MKKIIPFLCVATMTACGQSEAPPKTNTSTENIPTVEELASDLERLRDLRQKCRTDRAKVSEVLCNRAAEARNRRFFGDGKVPYTPPENPPKF